MSQTRAGLSFVRTMRVVMVTMPLVMLQRWLLKSANKFVSIKGKGARSKPMPRVNCPSPTFQLNGHLRVLKLSILSRTQWRICWQCGLER